MISIKDMADGFSTITKVIGERFGKRLAPTGRSQTNRTGGNNLPDSFYSPFVLKDGKLLKIFTYGISDYSQESEDVVVPSTMPRVAPKRYLLINSEDI